MFVQAHRAFRLLTLAFMTLRFVSNWCHTYCSVLCTLAIRII